MRPLSLWPAILFSVFGPPDTALPPTTPPNKTLSTWSAAFSLLPKGNKLPLVGGALQHRSTIGYPQTQHTTTRYPPKARLKHRIRSLHPDEANHSCVLQTTPPSTPPPLCFTTPHHQQQTPPTPPMTRDSPRTIPGARRSLRARRPPGRARPGRLPSSSRTRGTGGTRTGGARGPETAPPRAGGPPSRRPRV